MFRWVVSMVSGVASGPLIDAWENYIINLFYTYRLVPIWVMTYYLGSFSFFMLFTLHGKDLEEIRIISHPPEGPHRGRDPGPPRVQTGSHRRYHRHDSRRRVMSSRTPRRRRAADVTMEQP